MNTEPDLICLHGLQVATVIGVHNWERQVRQVVLLDLDLATDISPGAASDDIKDTLDYKEISKELIAFIEESSFLLLETLAEKAAMLVLDRFPVRWVRLRVCKQWALRQVRDVSIVITRGHK